MPAIPLERPLKIGIAPAGVSAAITLLIIAGIFVGCNDSAAHRAAARNQLLEFAPVDATSVLFADFEQLRASPFLARLGDWAPVPQPDSEYSQFVKETGFSFERDLDRIMIAVANNGASTSLFAIADGRFDRNKIENFLARNSTTSTPEKWKIYRWAPPNEKPISFTFLSDSRVALCDSDRLQSLLTTAHNDPRRADWTDRFARLAGAPAFALVRQDSALQNAIGNAAPHGLQSPQLAALLNQLQWISIAGTPQGDSLQVVADGESPSEQTNSQLSEMLQGLLLLAQNGLNDPKLRQQMDPSEREAYLEMVKSADVQKINRGDSKSLRVVVSITPKFLELARTAPSHAQAPETAGSNSAKKQAAGSAKHSKSK